VLVSGGLGGLFEGGPTGGSGSSGNDAAGGNGAGNAMEEVVVTSPPKPKTKPQTPKGVLINLNRPCDSAVLHRSFETYKVGQKVGEFGEWATGLSWATATYVPIPQVKVGAAIGTAVGAVVIATGYGLQFESAYQIYEQTGDRNFITNSAIGFGLDKLGILDKFLTPLGSPVGSSAIDHALQDAEGEYNEPVCHAG